MKQFLWALCLFLLLAVTVQAKGIQESINLTGDKVRTSYAFGMTVGGDLKQTGLEIDYAAFTEGLRTVMEGLEPIIDRDDALEIVQNAFESAMRKQAVELQAEEAAFLAENALRPGVTVTASGLQYEVLEKGNGPHPAANDTVRVHYEGALTSGAVFDSSYDRNEPEEIPLDMVIPGWAEGIQLMSVGSKYRIYLPSGLAYGERGAGQIIPPYSTLVFTVELFEIVPNEAETNALSGDSDPEN